jgi:hypothetical protein
VGLKRGFTAAKKVQTERLFDGIEFVPFTDGEADKSAEIQAILAIKE